MKVKSTLKFLVVCILIAILAYVAAFGCNLSFVDKVIPASLDEDFGIQKGFDLAGGSVIVFEPKGYTSMSIDLGQEADEADVKAIYDSVPGVSFTSFEKNKGNNVTIETTRLSEDQISGQQGVLVAVAAKFPNAKVNDAKFADREATVTDSDIDAAVAALRLRLDNEGMNEAVVAPQDSGESKRVRVEIPAVTNPDDAIEYLGAMAQLEFKDANGNVVMTGSNIVDAIPVYQNGQHVVQLTIDGEGQKSFAQATAAAASAASGNNYIAIFLDGTEISRPSVSETINSESCIITGGFTAEEAKMYANQIKSGTLPFALEPVQRSSVGAQLGDDALNKSLMAGAIGLILVVLYMVVFYRLCGLISAISLIGYISVVALILNGFNIQLTLPGIAGIILTIGTAVDANVIIFERVKEELKLGKTIRTSIEGGFHRAFSAIIDSNITTIIAAVVLWNFGSGTIVGFAKTLFIGTLVSMITAIFVTRFLLKQVCVFGPKNSKYYSA